MDEDRHKKRGFLIKSQTWFNPEPNKRQSSQNTLNVFLLKLISLYFIEKLIVYRALAPSNSMDTNKLKSNLNPNLNGILVLHLFI